MGKLTAMINETKALPHSIEKGTIQNLLAERSPSVHSVYTRRKLLPPGGTKAAHLLSPLSGQAWVSKLLFHLSKPSRWLSGCVP